MKINFTKKEYQLLVTMIEIADWVMNSFHALDRDDTKGHRSLRNKLLAYADGMGMEGCYQKDGETYYETVEYEENSPQSSFIEDYDEEVFWAQLVTRLSERDYALQYGDKEVDFKTKIRRFTEIEDKYTDEINNFGLLNFIIANKKNSSLH